MTVLNSIYTSQKITATQNEVALSSHIVRGVYFLAVVLMRSIDGTITSDEIITI